MLSREVRDAARSDPGGLGAAVHAAFEFLCTSEILAAAASTLDASPGQGDTDRLFNGRLIGLLNVLSDAAGGLSASRNGQCDVVVIAAALAGLSLLARSGRLSALGFSPNELAARIEARFRERS